MATATPTLRNVRAFSEATVLVPLVSLSLVWQLGAHADAWYHAHYGASIESVFTWTHAVLYAGWAGTAALALVRLARPEPLGRLRHSYELVVAGVVIFGAGGLLDFGWHTLFGFEAGLGTLFSPSHLCLLVGVLVANVGIFHASVVSRPSDRRSDRGMRMADIPVLLSFAALFRATLWTTFYAAPLAVDYASGGAVVSDLPAFAGVAWLNQAAQTAGTTGILLYSVMLALFLIALVRYLDPPRGGISTLLLWDGMLTVATTGMWLYLPAVALAALTGELWLAYVRRRQPDSELPAIAYWVLTGGVCATQFTAYFILMARFGGGIVWTTHLWTGTIVTAVLFAVVASVLSVPPPWATRKWNRS
jgi:hypothetical protein